jgi:hypothetical protein
MRKLILLLLVQCAWACGTERWPVKTLKSVGIPEKTVQTSVEQMTWLKPPTGKELYRAQKVRFPDEEYRYEVTVWLLGMVREDDGDYHLVLSDEDNKKITMVAEIPNPDCVQPSWKPLMAVLRVWLDKHVGKPTTDYKPLPKPLKLEVMGVGFFDYLHGQDGAAPNGIELHPILSMCMDSEMSPFSGPSCVGQEQP